MRAAGITLGIGLLALAVVWLLSKMTRTDEADWLLVKLGIGFAAGVLTLVAALAIGRRKRTHSSSG